MITTYYKLLESYKDKLSNKLHFIGIILDSLKVISEKPQVNQVVPYSHIPQYTLYMLGSHFCPDLIELGPDYLR